MMMPRKLWRKLQLLWAPTHDEMERCCKNDKIKHVQRCVQSRDETLYFACKEIFRQAVVAEHAMNVQEPDAMLVGTV